MTLRAVEPQRTHPLRLLIIPPIGIGNFLMVLPAIKLLNENLQSKKATPNSSNISIGLLSLKPLLSQMAKQSHLFDEVFEWDPDKESIMKGIKVIHKIRKWGAHHSISLFPTGHTKFTLFHRLCGAPQRWGYSYPFTKWPEKMLTHTTQPDLSLHDVEQNINLIQFFLRQSKLSTNFSFESLEKKSIPLVSLWEDSNSGQSQVKPSNSYWVCHPGSSAERGMDKKRLPTHTFAELAIRIHKEFGVQTALIGGPEEKGLREELIQRVQKEDDKAILNIKIRSFEDTVQVIQNAKAFYGNDSGLMHLAASLNIPCISFFGPTDETRTGPWPIANHLVLRKHPLSCAPCWTGKTLGKNEPCIHGDYRCTQQLELNEIWESFSQWVQTRKLHLIL